MTGRLELIASILALLDEGATFAARRPDAVEVARHLARSGEAVEVNRAAKRVARTNEYLVRQRRSGSVAGRELIVDSILSLGLGAALASGLDLDRERVAEEIADYLGGPSVDLIRLVGLDADLVLEAPVPVVDGWELFVADEAFLRGLLPVPSLSNFAPRPAWSSALWSGVAFLRVSAPDARPIVGHSFSISPAFHEWEVWRPLLVLALASPDIVAMWTDHDVEPGRAVRKRLDRVVYETNSFGFEEEDEYESPFRVSIGLEPDGEDAFRARVAELASLFPAESDAAKGRSRVAQGAYRRLRVAGQRLLAAGEHAASAYPTPIDDVHAAEALVHYVVALESLLAPDGKEGEISRRVAQRAAVLVGRDDDERLRVLGEVKRAYGLRSESVHGSGDPKELDLALLRAVVRRAMVARLVLGDPVRGGSDDLHGLCDRALVSGVELSRVRAAMAPLDDIALP